MKTTLHYLLIFSWILILLSIIFQSFHIGSNWRPFFNAAAFIFSYALHMILVIRKKTTNDMGATLNPIIYAGLRFLGWVLVLMPLLYHFTNWSDQTVTFMAMVLVFVYDDIASFIHFVISRKRQ